MSVPEQNCPQCGLPMEAGKPCPNCLLKMVSQSTDQIAAELEISGETTDSPKLAEPELEAVQAAFPQLEILEKVGRGGMGTVFKARQPKLDRFVALKILSPHLAGTPAHFSARFAREGKLLAKLSHPNIVTVYDFGQADGFYYLIMEFVEGVNLRQAMREERFTPEQALAIVPKICEALQYAHDEGVLHRDIKPENILLDAKGRVKIADFGIGKLTNTQIRAGSVSDRLSPEIPEAKNITQTGQVLGTPSYMAPEQREDPNRVDHRADIYSLGVVFYELLTGELPKGRFPLPSEKTPVDADIDAIVLKALEREREKRQQSTGELKTEIEDLPSRRTELPLDDETRSRWSLGGLVGKILVEVKTWPIWARILTGFVFVWFILPLLLLLIVIPMGLVVGVTGRICELLYDNSETIQAAMFPHGYPLVAAVIVLLVSGFANCFFRKKHKEEVEAKEDDGNVSVRKLWVHVLSTIIGTVCFWYLCIGVWSKNGLIITLAGTVAFILYIVLSVMRILELHRKSISSNINRNDKDVPEATQNHKQSSSSNRSAS